MSVGSAQPTPRSGLPAGAGLSPAPRPAPQTSPAPNTPKAATDSIIRLRGLRKAFGSQTVLAGIDLDIPRGKTTVILGPSGCGKSVTLKHIVGLLRPDAGEVFFEDLRVDNLSEKQLREVRLQIGFLFQMGALFDSMSVMQNLLFPLEEHTRLSPDEQRRRVRDALERVDLHGIEHKLPSQLSGGQRKRVALARAIVLEPRVVLYDEPTTGLDPIRSDGIDQLVLKLERELGVTSIVVTHDLISARKISEKVVMLLDGKVAAEGTYDQIAAWPDPRVQQFVQGRYDRDDDKPGSDDDDDTPSTSGPSKAKAEFKSRILDTLASAAHTLTKSNTTSSTSNTPHLPPDTRPNDGAEPPR
jgi:phospholipid/cholesterol/gamma-HCH transport system ATP-binding protein